MRQALLLLLMGVVHGTVHVDTGSAAARRTLYPRFCGAPGLTRTALSSRKRERARVDGRD
jgi:hypothetical protein